MALAACPLVSISCFSSAFGRVAALTYSYMFVRWWKRLGMLNQTMKGFLLAPVALGVQLFLTWGVPCLIIPDIPIVSGIKSVIWSTVIVLDFLKLRYLIPYASNRLGITLIIFLQDGHALNKLCGYLEHFLEVAFLALLLVGLLVVLFAFLFGDLEICRARAQSVRCKGDHSVGTFRNEPEISLIFWFTLGAVTVPAADPVMVSQNKMVLRCVERCWERAQTTCRNLRRALNMI